MNASSDDGARFWESGGGWPAILPGKPPTTHRWLAVGLGLAALVIGGTLYGFFWQENRWHFYASELAVTVDGRTIATADRDTVKVWDAVTGKLLATLVDRPGRVTALAFSSDGHRLAVGCDGAKGWTPKPVPGLWELWDLRNRRLLHMGAADHSAIRHLVFLKGDAELAAADAKAISLWDINDGKRLAAWPTPHFPAGTAACLSDGVLRVPLSAPQRPTAIAWDLPTGTERGQVALVEGEPRTAVISADGRFLTIGGGRQRAPGAVSIRDLASDRLVANVSPCTDQVLAVHLGGNGSTLLVVDREGVIDRWDLSRHPPQQLARHETRQGRLLTAAFAREGQVAVLATQEALTVWDTESGRQSLTVASRAEDRQRRFTTNLWLGLCLVGGVLAFWLVLRRLRALRHQLAAERVAGQLGLCYSPNVPAASLGPVPRMYILHGAFRSATHALWGTIDGCAAAVLNLNYAGPKWMTLSVRAVVFPGSGGTLPEFTLCCKDWLVDKLKAVVHLHGIDFADSPEGLQFSRQYELKGTDELSVRAAFTPEVVRYFAAHPKWFVACQDGWLVLRRERHWYALASPTTKGIAELLQAALEIRRILLVEPPPAH